MMLDEFGFLLLRKKVVSQPFSETILIGFAMARKPVVSLT